jgi:hypothetical protein
LTAATRAAFNRTMWKVILLLTLANVFMTFAWYGHLGHKDRALPLVVLVSWGIALVEYCFQVPANRLGHQLGYSAAHLKTVQEVLTLLVFAGFSVLYLGEPIRWNVVVGFVLIAFGATFIFEPWAIGRRTASAAVESR